MRFFLVGSWLVARVLPGGRWINDFESFVKKESRNA
jgi:hypothetical protein